MDFQLTLARLDFQVNDSLPNVTFPLTRSFAVRHLPLACKVSSLLKEL